MLLHWTTLMQQLKKLFTNGHLHCGSQVFITLKKCTAIICVSGFYLFSVNYFILTKSLNQLLTIVYFIYSVLVVK